MMPRNMTATTACIVLVLFKVIASSRAFGLTSYYPTTATSVFELQRRSSAAPLFFGMEDVGEVAPTDQSRRFFVSLTVVGAFACLSPSTIGTAVAATTNGDGQSKLSSSLYSILRVREAIAQETRLIKSGKFKDAQRANVKLAVKFILYNYRLDENFIKSSAFLEGERRYQAADVGQRCVQSLQTILEYFDSSDVQNIRVSTSGLGDKEVIVLKGLDASKSTIDEFLAYFPADVVSSQREKIKEENDLNTSEFDSSLGTILNPDPAKT